MKKLIVLIIIITISILLAGENSAQKQKAKRGLKPFKTTTQIIDSLKHQINKIPVSTEQVDILNKLAEQYLDPQPDSALFYAYQSIDQAKELNYDIGLVDGLCNLGNAQLGKVKYDSAQENFTKALEISKRINYLEGMGNNYSGIGNVFLWKKKFPDAQSNFNEALNIFKKCDYGDGVGKVYYYYGNLYKNQRLTDSALFNYKEALKIFEDIEDNRYIMKTCSVIGNMYFYQQNFSKTLEYYEKSLAQAVELEDEQMESYRLGSIGVVYSKMGSFQKALEYQEKSLALSEKLGEKEIISRTYINMGTVYNYMSNYPKALEYFQNALKIDEEIGNKRNIPTDLGSIGLVYIDLKDFQTALPYYEKALKIEESFGESADKRNISLHLGNMGNIYSQLSNFPKAIECYERSMKINEELGDRSGVSHNLLTLADIYSGTSNYSKALEYLQKAMDITKEIEDKSLTPYIIAGIGYNHYSIAVDSLIKDTTGRVGHLNMSVDYYKKAINQFKDLGFIDFQKDYLLILSKSYEKLGDWQNALDAFKEATVLKDSIFSGENLKKIAELEAKRENEVKQKEIELLKKDNQIQELDIAQKSQQMNLLKKSQEIQALELSKRNNDLTLLQKDKELTELDLKQKNIESESSAKEISLLNKNKDYDQVVRSSLIGVLSIIFLIFVLVLFFLWRKRKDNKLLKTKNQLIDIEREKSDALLHNILPPPIALRLKEGESTIADHFDEASVIFLDISQFTLLSKDSSPERIVEMLNKIYTEFDKIAEKHGLEKIKTIGDCYMAASGVPVPRKDHAEAAASFAIEAMTVMNGNKSHKTPEVLKTSEVIEEIQFRCGIDCGPVVAGVIGESKFIYDLWGDTVNTASRMEEYGEPGRIQVTERFFKKLGMYKTSEVEENFGSLYNFEERGEIEIKGKGIMRTYFLEK